MKVQLNRLVRWSHGLTVKHERSLLNKRFLNVCVSVKEKGVGEMLWVKTMILQLVPPSPPPPSISAIAQKLPA